MAASVSVPVLYVLTHYSKSFLLDLWNKFTAHVILNPPEYSLHETPCRRLWGAAALSALWKPNNLMSFFYVTSSRMLLCTTLCFYSNVEAKDGRFIKWEHWCELHTVPVYPLHILNETKILTELRFGPPNNLRKNYENVRCFNLCEIQLLYKNAPSVIIHNFSYGGQSDTLRRKSFKGI